LSDRDRELFGLIPVAVLVTAGFTAVFIVQSEQLGNLSVLYGAYFLGLCLAAHLLLRARLPDADPFLFPLVALLAAFGLVMIYRIDESLARDQANWFVLGLLAFAATIVFLRDYEALERYRYVIAATGILLLVLPRFLGSPTNEAYLSVDIGSLTFQPTELAKICIVVFLASYLREKREVLVLSARRVLGITLPPLKHLGPLLVVWGASMLMLVFIRDLGSSLMFFAAFLAVLYVATARISFVIIGLGMFFLGAWLVAGQVAHVQERFDIWLDPFAPEVVEKGGYQVAQSLFTQADGGLFGRGLADSLIQLPLISDECAREFPNCGAILPAPHTDFIYAVIVNELGLFGGAAVVLIYALITARGFKTALVADDGFSKLLATGLTAVFAFQAFVIIGGVTRAIPLTGVTLPFISYGGSSIFANFILIALLLMISDSARRRARVEREAALEEAP
jgi:cell division protein FtsW (lipid II flippase)